MSAKIVTPTLAAESFNCPSCGALAHQDWFQVLSKSFDKEQGPFTVAPDAVERINNDKTIGPEIRASFAKYFQKKLEQLPFFETLDHNTWTSLQLENVCASKCYSCGALAIWVYDRIIFPQTKFTIDPNDDLNEDIKLDFREATKIIDLSPRGAAALLRLCVQKLCIQLGEAGKNIDADIANLVKKGLETSLQQALDIVRVIGNEAVHPGQIDLRDDRETAIKLFQLINIIADAMISRPKQIAQLYGKLPETKIRAIEKRDAPKK